MRGPIRGAIGTAQKHAAPWLREVVWNPQWLIED